MIDGFLLVIIGIAMLFISFIMVVSSTFLTGAKRKATENDIVLCMITFAIIFIGGAFVFYGIHATYEQDKQELLNNEYIREYCTYLGTTDSNFIDDCKHLTAIIPNSSYGSIWSWLKDPKSADLCAEIVGEGDDLFQRCISELQSKGLFTSHLEVTNP